MANKYLYADKTSRIDNGGYDIIEKDCNEDLNSLMTITRDFNSLLNQKKLLPIDDEDLSKTRMAQSDS